MIAYSVDFKGKGRNSSTLLVMIGSPCICWVVVVATTFLATEVACLGIIQTAQAFSSSPCITSPSIIQKRRRLLIDAPSQRQRRFQTEPSSALYVLPHDDEDDKDVTTKPKTADNNRNNNADGDLQQDDSRNWLERRLQKADLMEMRRDAVLVSCFVLSRFLVYDILTSVKVTPGWVVQDVVWLTGTFSSATVLVIYWTLAGLLSKSFETSRTAYGPVQVLVNVALCCPIWLATEHFLQFGPSNIGGDSLGQAIATGFLGLASFMTLARALTSGWE